MYERPRSSENVEKCGPEEVTRPVFAWMAVASAVMSEKPQRTLGFSRMKS